MDASADLTSGHVLWQTKIGMRTDPIKGASAQDHEAEEFWQLPPPLVAGDQVVVAINCGYVAA